MPELTSTQFKALRDALVDAFDPPTFAQMSRLGLGKKLAAIVGPGGLEQAAFDLIEWAESKGRTLDLIRAACEANAGNPELQRFCTDHPAFDPAKATPAGVSALPHDIEKIVKYAPAELIGREMETKLLTDAWKKAVRGTKNRPHVLTFVALGGEGKTSLVAKWAVELQMKKWPGCEACFAWSFYRDGIDEKSGGASELFLNAALTFFGDAAMAGGSAGAFEKGKRLAGLVGEKRALLILDGLEPLQYAPTSPTPGELKDQGISALLKGLAGTNRGLCIVTTRYSIPDLKAFRQTTAPEHDLKRLPRAAGVHLLKTLGVTGSAKDFAALVEDVKGHALTLTLLGGFLKRAFGGDIRKRDRVKFAKADEKIDGGHAFRTMAAYEKWLLRDGGDEGKRQVAVLRLMGLFDRPANAGCLAALRREVVPDLTEPIDGLADDDWEFCLTGLEDAKLLTVNRDRAGTLVSLDAHPHLRDYFAKQLREQQPDAWRAGHKRLYEHLCKTTSDKKPNPTLDDLQPLYQAVAHGCHAGLQQTACRKVYSDRIQRGQEFYSTKKLGAFGSDLGAVACFFETLWIRVSAALTNADQAWMLNEAAYTLRALGRLTEALEPMRAVLKRDIKAEEWKEAASSASNLSELELTLGILEQTVMNGVEVAGAVADAEQSGTFADRTGDWGQRMINRTTHADALHQAGRRADGEALFRAAEQIQADAQPKYPLLLSLPGFRYGDLLMTDAEHAAWGNVEGGGRTAEVIAACRAVSARAEQTLKWVSEANLDILSCALEHLTLGRAVLFEAIVTGSDLGVARAELDAAVSGLRHAGVSDYLVRGLLTRAWLRALDGKPTGPDSAQEDLDEAWEIAERGPMRLHMADIHLYRARLFFRVASYPWESPKTDLDAAEKLINDSGYHRRDEELADAQRLILGAK